MAELTRILSKSLCEVIKFSTNRDMFQSCLQSLKISQASEIEETIHSHLMKWNLDFNNDLEQSNASCQLASLTTVLIAISPFKKVLVTSQSFNFLKPKEWVCQANNELEEWE